jgi:hypothetical protein
VGNGEMIVTIDDIRQKFDDLISERTSREEIASFASQAMMAEDQHLLILLPHFEKLRIFGAILYLSGVDLLDFGEDYQRDAKGTYLHSIENFVDYRKSFGL